MAWTAPETRYQTSWKCTGLEGLYSKGLDQSCYLAEKTAEAVKL